MNNHTDGELIQKTLNGETEAFGELVRRYQDAVYATTLHRTGNFTDAQDVAQEAFIEAYKNLHKLRETVKFPSWLHTITLRQCSRWRRSQKETISFDELNSTQILEFSNDRISSPDKVLEHKELQQTVLNTISSLPEKVGEVVTMYYIDGLSYSEIASFLSIPKTTVKGRLQMGRKQLKEELINMVEGTLKQNRPGDEFPQKVLRSISTFNEINDIAFSQDGKSIWYATRGGVMKFNIRTSSFTKYTTTDGLRDNNVMSIAVDTSDRVWCATAGGVCMFDGEKWNLCSDLPSDIGMYTGDMDDITVDKNDVVWIATHGWVWKGETKGYVCKLEEENWKLYSIDEKLRGVAPVVYADKDGHIWYGAEHGISKLQNEQWITYILEHNNERNHVFSILQDSKSNMWFGTGKGIWKFDGSDWTVYSSGEGLNPGSIYALAKDKDSSIWAGQNSILYSFDGTEWISHCGEGMPSSRIDSIVIDNQGNKWIGTSREGLYKFDGTKWTNYSVAQKLPSSYVIDVLTDKQANLWATTWRGIVRYDGKNWQNIQDIPLSSVKTMFCDIDGSLWFGGFSGGICKLDSTGWKVYRKEEQGNSFEQQEYDIQSIAQDSHGNLWFVTIKKGIWKFNGKEWIQFTVEDGLHVDTAYCLFIDNSDIVWVGTSRGICKYNGKSWITVTEKGSPIQKHVFCIATDSNQNIWFGTWENGIYKYDGNSWSHYTSEDGLADNFVNDITLEPDGRMWFGTNSGLSCFDGQIWTSYSTEQGLASNIINSLAIASNGVLWIGTTGGLSCMNLY